jgi:hypothetical protein
MEQAMKLMEFTADQVWGLVIRADQTNGGYVKEEVWDYTQESPVLVKDTNKKLVKRWLMENQHPSEQEIELGRACRESFNSLTFKALRGDIGDFDRTTARIVQMEKFTGRDMLEFAIVSCLPEIARREQQRDEQRRELFYSEPIAGQPGDVLTTDIRVTSCRYNQNYNKYRIQGRVGDSFVDFFFGKELSVGHEYRVRAKIKTQRGDKTTQLNYVKLL